MTIKKCDLCGSEKNVQEWTLPVYKLHDSTDGLTKYDSPHVFFKKLDICQECLSKSTNICDDTVMGYGNVFIKTNPLLQK